MRCTLLPFPSLLGDNIPCPWQKVRGAKFVKRKFRILCEIPEYPELEGTRKDHQSPTQDLTDLLLPYVAAFTIGKSLQHHILICQYDQMSLEGGDPGRVA